MGAGWYFKTGKPCKKCRIGKDFAKRYKAAETERKLTQKRYVTLQCHQDFVEHNKQLRQQRKYAQENTGGHRKGLSLFSSFFPIF
mmetsp:Transcript_7023/g.7943  ORF Transcript_7023/g.7943 Transcript_7023/m.7943 type:complete len:85 (-) Transcript_7023:68-322(-)